MESTISIIVVDLIKHKKFTKHSTHNGDIIIINFKMIRGCKLRRITAQDLDVGRQYGVL